MTTEILFHPSVFQLQCPRESAVSLLSLQRRKEIQGHPPPSLLREHYRVSVCRLQECLVDGRAEKNAYLIIFRNFSYMSSFQLIIHVCVAFSI